MNTMQVRYIGCMMLVTMTALYAFPKTCTWTGSSGTNIWADDGNWDRAPSAGDTMVFNVAGDLAVSYTTGGDGGKYRPGSILVESGNVTVTIGTSDSNMYMSGATNELAVASDATLKISDHKYIIFDSSAVCRKTGDGTFHLYGQRFDHGQNISSLRIESGTFLIEGKSSDIMAQLYANKEIVVFEDAEFYVKGAVSGAGGKVELREGSVLRLEDNFITPTAGGWNCGIVFDNISGPGSIIGETGTKLSQFQLRQTYDVPPFTGSVTGNVRIKFEITADRVKNGQYYPFVVQSADQFSECVGFSYPGLWLKFKQGVGTFDIGGVYGGNGGTVYPQDLDGKPIVLYAGSYTGWALSWSGKGDVWFREIDGSGFTGSRWNLDGWLGVLDGGDVKLGRPANNDYFDFSLAGATVKGVRAAEGGTVSLYGESDLFPIEIPVRGQGTYTFGNGGYGAKLTDLVLDGASKIVMYGKTEFAGGDVNVCDIEGNGGRSRVNKITAGRIYNGLGKGALETETSLSSPRGVTTVGNIGLFSLSLEGGEFWWENGNALQNIYLRGGVFHPTSGCRRNMTATCIKDGPVETVFDGGTAHLDFTDDTTFQFFSFGNTYDNAENTRFYVTGKGGSVVARRPNGHEETMTAETPNSFEIYPDATTSGMLAFSGWSDFVFGAPMALNGPVSFRDGTAVVGSSQLDGSSAPFGTGDLCLRNARVFLDDRSGAGHGISSIALAGGSGSAVVYEGACEIAARNSNSSTAAKSVTATALRRAGKGSVLYLRDGVSNNNTVRRIGEGGYSTVKLASAPDLDADTGLPCQPVLIGQVQGEALVTYDADKGFVPHNTKYAPATTVEEASADKVLIVQAGKTFNVAEGTTVEAAALCCSNFGKFATHANATLKVGNGTDPAMVVLGVCGGVRGAYGYLDFGTSEGVISVSNSTGVEDGSANFINSIIKGSGGVSFVSDPDMINEHRIFLYCNAEYTGGTRISAVRVFANNTRCFAGGDVYVFGGEASGGAVLLNRENGTWANAFHLAGHGYHDAVNPSRGCLEFRKTAAISGPVELTEEARIDVASGMTGVITGVVSGDRLKLFRSEGLLKLTNVNSYTGGTEVAKSVLSVAREGGLGTGELLLDDGTVVFENTEAMTVANALRGVGTLKVTGAEARFTGRVDPLSDLTVDYAGTDVRLTHYPTFAKVKNSAPGRLTLTLAAPGSYTIDPDRFAGSNIRIELEDGAQIDLAGGTLTVNRFSGDRTAVNGTIAETNPRKGLMILAR